MTPRIGNRARNYLTGALIAATALAVVAGLSYDQRRIATADSGYVSPPVELGVSEWVDPNTPLAVARPVDRPLRLLFAGDSLTGGYYASTPATKFSALVAGELRTTDVVTAQQAGQGIGTVSAITNVDSGVDLAILQIGTNDFKKTPSGEFLDSYRQLMQKIRDTSPGAQFICVGAWHEGVGRFDAGTGNVCRSFGGRFVGVAELYRKKELHSVAGTPTEFGLADDFHPNDAGHRAIADEILGALNVA